MRNTRYPAAALEQNVTGTNFISFEVDNSGAILNPTALKSPAASMQAEVLRVFKGSVPVLNGLEGKYIIPIIFIISGPGRVNIDTAIDMAKYGGYKKLEPVFIRGYVPEKKPDLISESLGGMIRQNKFTYITTDETKQPAGKIVNYIKVDYLKNPIILVNGKVANYTVTEKGFKLDDTIYPDQPEILIYESDEAVKHYNESARDKGLIVFTTKKK